MKNNLIDDEPAEFNLMALYLKRIDERSTDRDLALNEGDVEKLYRTTMTILINTIPKFEEKKIPYEETFKNVELIGKQIHTANQNTNKSNLLIWLGKLIKSNIHIERLKFKAGMVYPEKEIRTIEDVRKDDY